MDREPGHLPISVRDAVSSLIWVKIIALGTSAAGKTSIIKHFCEDKFSAAYQPTVGVDYGFKIQKVKNIDLRVHLWDLSGQLEYAEVRSELYGGTQACILVFDVTNRNSFDNLEYWLKEAIRHGVGIMHTVVVANKGTLSTETIISHQILKNWREFFRLPSVQRRKKEKAALPSYKAPAASFQPIKCISSKVKVDSSQGERGQRLLEKVTVDGRRVKTGAGLGEVFCTPVPEKLTVDTKNRTSGVSHYGNLDMTWTTGGPIRDKSEKFHRKVISMTAVSPRHTKEYRKQWLHQQQMLYPSLYNMRILDENRKRHAAAAVQAKQKSLQLPSLAAIPSSRNLVYRWTTPEPVVFSKKLRKRASLVKSLGESRITEVKKGKLSTSRTTHIYLPYLPFNVPETPVAPQNSTISHQSSTRLPKIPTASAGNAVKCMEDNSRNAITIPLQ